MQDVPAAPLIYTIGHSNRTIEEFLEMLKAYEIEEVVDVRTVPRSRHNPQFAQENLPQSLQQAGIDYSHIKGLGGLRRPQPDSSNAGWRNLSFRGYADYMQTPEFLQNLDTLIALARQKRVAIMCAEAVPWRCHRSLIADALVIRGLDVIDIISKTNAKSHKLTPWAHVEGTTIMYPPTEEVQIELQVEG